MEQPAAQERQEVSQCGDMLAHVEGTSDLVGRAGRRGAHEAPASYAPASSICRRGGAGGMTGAGWRAPAIAASMASLWTPLK